MLTPAEELGLSGLSLASRVRKAFFRIPEQSLGQLMDRIRQESIQRRLVYLREGEVDTVHVMPMPITLLPEQMAYVHYVSQTILNALKRLPELYFRDRTVRKLLWLSDAEKRWLRESWGPALRDNNPMFSRLDAMVDFISPMWKDTLKFVEPNLSGIGGLHLVPTAEAIIHDLVLPVLRAQDPQLRLERCQDVRELLVQEMLDHLQALGRATRTLCFVEPKYASSGPDEQAAVVAYYRRRHGLNVLHADPTELSLKGNEVYYQGECIDLAYRDYTVDDLAELKLEGKDVEPVRALFRQNRMISSIGAEIDQKNCWEILTEPRLAKKYFSPDERQVFRRHILWTRWVAERNTTLPDGQAGKLLDFIRAERERLVLKPNRSYGGYGVVIGHLATSAEWEAALQEALAETDGWVVQELASIPVSEFPVIAPDGKVHFEPFYTVMGFAPSKYGVSIMARASQKQVVNVALRGGMCVVLTGRPPAALIGPRAGGSDSSV